MGDGTEGANANVVGITGGVGGNYFKGEIELKVLGILQNTDMRIAITDNQVGDTVLRIADYYGYTDRVDIYMSNKIENSPYLTSKYAEKGSIERFNTAADRGANVMQVPDATDPEPREGIFGKLLDWIEGKNSNKDLSYTPQRIKENVVTAEGKVIASSDEMIIFQNNNQKMTDRIISSAKESGKPTMINRFLRSFPVSSTMLNCFGVVAGALSAFLDYQDMKSQIDYINKLLNKKSPLTEEEAKFLEDSGIPTASNEINESNWKDLKIASGGHRGNPYHDRLGRFCSAADAITVSG